MTELRVHNFSISLDGYAAGPAQTEQDPLGAGAGDCMNGSSPALFGDLGDALDGWTCVEFTPSVEVAHVRLRRG
jgi:hypothetical protein